MARRSLLVIVLGMFLLIGVQSCDKRSCADVACQGAAICEDGECVCPSYLESNDCLTLARNKFLGVYYEQSIMVYVAAGDTYDLGSNFILTFDPLNSDLSRIILKDLSHFTGQPDVIAYVSGNEFSSAGEGDISNVEGVLVDGIITMTYAVDDGSAPEPLMITSTCSPQ